MELLDQLAGCTVAKSLPTDTVIFYKGDPPTGFVLILSGRVKVYCESQEGQEQVLNFFEAGESFAEAALFMPGYPATARTMTACDLLFMPKARFQQLLSTNSELALQMITSLAVKQKKFVRMIEDLTLRDARGRLCHYLSRLLGDVEGDQTHHIKIPVSQGALAHLLGVTEETLSKTIRSLRKDGVLTSATKGRFKIADLSKLKEAYAI